MKADGCAQGHTGGVEFLPGGDLVLAGSFRGTVDLGGGAVQSGNGGVEPSVYVVRRGP